MFQRTAKRAFSSALHQQTKGEQEIINILKSQFSPKMLEVQDVSGGCGSMYNVKLSSAKFKGLSLIKQHQLVNKSLAEQIKKMHGIQITTVVAE